MTELDKTANQSTQVAFILIEAMAAIGEPVALSELARRVGMPKPRVFRFLRTLLAMGYVLQDEATGRYRLSLKLFHLGQAIADQTMLLTEARPLMVQLRNATRQTTTLSVVEAEGMRIMDIVRADTPVQIVTRPGSVLDFHSSAQGRLALAYGPAERLDAALSKPLTAWTPATQTDPARLRGIVADVRKAGWADAPEQTLVGINALAAPIFDASNQMIATVTIAGPLNALTSPPDRALVDAVRRTGRTISTNLGCTEYPE